MKNILTVAAIVLACSAISIAQSDLVTVAGPGMAGNASCRVYFGVYRLNSYDKASGPAHGFTEDELRWWKGDGQKKSPGLCYMSDTDGKWPDLKAQCSQCPPDWSSSFYWILLRRNVVTHKAVPSPSVPATVEQGDRAYRAHNGNIPLTTFPDDDPHPGTERATVTITAEIYPVTRTGFVWNADTRHFKVSKRGVFLPSTPTSYESVEREIFKEAAKQVLDQKKKH